jgi:hypothetical protein
MHRIDEQGGWRGGFGLATLGFAATALALALVFPAPVLASPVALEVQKEGGGSGTVLSVPSGISCGTTCEAAFGEGEEVTLTATPDPGSEFVEWEGCDSGPTGNCRVTMGEPRVVTAIFKEAESPEYLLSIEEGGNGEGEWECLVGGEEVFCEEEFPAGTHVTIKATPYEGSRAAVFAGDCTGSTCSLIMDKDHTVTVIFNLKEFTLTVNKNGGASSGKVECELEEGPEPCKSKYPWGTEVIVIAVAEPGYEFVKWEGCDKEPQPGSCEVEIEAARTVTVTFGKQPSAVNYTLKVNNAGTGTGTGTVTSSPSGISCGATCEAKFEEGKEVTLTATPAGGSSFAGWSGGGCSGTSTCKVTMSAAKEVTATFNLKPKPKFTLTVQREGSGSGSVTSDPAGIECGADCSEDYAEGTTVTLTATPAAGSSFKRWSGVEGGCALEPVCRTKMGASKVVKAVFESVDPAPRPEGQGMAKIGKRVALVRGGRALLELRCSGGPCKGGLRLIARLRIGGKARLVIGTQSFSLVSGGRKTIAVKLSGRARQEVARRGKLGAKVLGGGVLQSTVELKNAKKRR